MFESLYIHFPYCLYKCHYCDFNSYAYEKSEIPQNDYLQALQAEITYWADRVSMPKKIKTIFFGGGTPSLMPAAHVAQILDWVQGKWGLDQNCEVTLESNPGTVSASVFAEFQKAGINRISLGIQSFDDHNLKRFGRIHTGAEARQALAAACSVFSNVSCDLIFGFPDQTFEAWQNDLQVATAFPLNHISCYALTAEPQTQYSFDLKAGKYAAPLDDLMADMQNLTYDFLAQKNLAAYEISNFAREGQECRHNLAYWHYDSYLGLGAGATSQFIKSSVVERHTNFKRPQDYMAGVMQNHSFLTPERIVYPHTVFEYLMMNLRLRHSFVIADFQDRWGEPVWGLLEPVVKTLCRQNFLTVDNGRLGVTRLGFLFNHRLVASFFEPLENSAVRHSLR